MVYSCYIKGRHYRRFSGEVERLAQRDIEALLSHLREIYVSSNLEVFTSRVVSTLSRILPSESVSYLEMDLQSRKTDSPPVVNPPSSDYASQARIFERHIHEHPLINHYRQTGEGRAVKISDFLTESQWHRRALYNEFYKELRGVEYQMAIVTPTVSAEAGIAFSRSGRDFSERDRSVLDLLRPHLMQAYRNATALTQIQNEASHFRQELGDSERGMIELSSKDRIQWCNEKAKRCVEEYFEPSRETDRLPESLTRWVEHQKSLLSTERDVPPPRKPLILDRPGKHLSVRLAADAAEEETNLLILEERYAPLSIDSLQDLGLTAREAEVLIHTARGKTNKEMASVLYISPRTVKRHLDNVYRKFDVTSRTEALSHALRVLNVLD